MSSRIEPFRADVPQAALDDLHERLARTRFPEQIPDAGWDYGVEREWLRDVIEYWRDEYDWRARESALNELEHFTTTIDGARIHFVHARSPQPDALPLVMTHGWPGSIVEFLDVIGPLCDPERHGGRGADAFHVVCPSLPGYAFSGPTRERGWHPGRIGAAWADLMSRLGYSRYVAQGGDWGAFVSRSVALADPEHCAGIHVNLLAPLPTGDADDWTPEERECIEGFQQFMDDGAGYFREHSTRPQTVSYALEDSPAGLAAWILEKFREWSDCDGDVEQCFTRDRLLDNLMLYWVTGTAHSSVRLYYEFDKALRSGALGFSRVETPTGYARYPKEQVRTSRRWAEQQYNIVHFADMPRGGHFAAMEQPELFTDDLRACFGRFR